MKVINIISGRNCICHLKNIFQARNPEANVFSMNTWKRLKETTEVFLIPCFLLPVGMKWKQSGMAWEGPCKRDDPIYVKNIVLGSHASIQQSSPVDSLGTVGNPSSKVLSFFKVPIMVAGTSDALQQIKCAFYPFSPIRIDQTKHYLCHKGSSNSSTPRQAWIRRVNLFLSWRSFH